MDGMSLVRKHQMQRPPFAVIVVDLSMAISCGAADSSYLFGPVVISCHCISQQIINAFDGIGLGASLVQQALYGLSAIF
jgi:hypothetical protein